MNAHTRQRTAAEQAFIDAYGDCVGDLPGNEHVLNARDLAIEWLKEQGLPGRKVESWHYTDLRTLLRSVPAFDATAGTNAQAPLIAGSCVAAISNGATLSMPRLEGAAFASVADMLIDGSFAPALPPRGPDDAIGRINTAFVSDGWFVDIAEGADLGAPIEIQLIQASGQGHVRLPMRVGKGARAAVVERHLGGSADAFSTSISHLDIADDAEVTWIVVREKNDAGTELCQFNARLGAKAKLLLVMVNAGGKLVRHEVHVGVSGEGADFRLRGIDLLSGQSHTDLTMTIEHEVESTSSTAIVRNVVADRANGCFQGQIRVAPAAQRTNARMACNSLLLSDDAAFSAKPELEIFADDVQCGHGATVTEIDHNHLFYLMARGIPEREARGLLVKAFVMEIVEELEDEAVAEALTGVIESWLENHG